MPKDETVGGTVLSTKTSASFVLLDEGKARRFPVTHVRSTLAGDRFEVGAPSDAESMVDCLEIRRNPAEALTLSDFRRRFHQALEAQAAVTGYSFGFADLGGVTGRDAASSYERWRLEARPEGDWVGGSFRMHVLEVDPATGWVEAATLAPGQFDQGGWPAP